MKGLVTRVLDSSFIDGPGHRAVIFMQGCDFACLYCHNPETRGFCDNCGACISACPNGVLSPGSGRPNWEASLCSGCDACLAACPCDSSPKAQEREASELAGYLADIAPFLDGITFSGGECSLQAGFLMELAGLVSGLRNGAGRSLTSIADTNGNSPAEVFDPLLEGLDGFIFDLKAFAEAPHRELTGLGGERVLRNLRAAAEAGKLVEVRTVLVEGFNDREEDLREAARLVASLGDKVLYRLIPFRPQGVKGRFSEMPPFDAGRYRNLVEVGRSVLGDRLVTPPLE